jgi:hypothetical protein
LLLSVRDVDDELVVLSLNALATLVPLVGGDMVIGSDRHQLFSRGQPKVVYDLDPFCFMKTFIYLRCLPLSKLLSLRMRGELGHWGFSILYLRKGVTL